ncbi:wax ester/triacylglycerol synthase family O-acyltransferase [Amycolatopsis sp. FDAARGOS 1241]|uniref:wax ester/triacylglycerol synthase family O-acyltransferase n=1 Tax=Amycolatopsis sp. FDAARGOS 1241 TaxID=2778070 RepID=UPI00194E3524|nr:wax ester/triacylglycerol synthase family O-acyltransferase [Amycolatopsis sp. FDAARGOS 1241]QRP42897.1 wax ester/triacylglycerol synthase family O-acyltransferase [Amycolatopsis sp. FDAARGOS 1241]
MERLSPLDAAFLEIEDEDPRAALAIASLAIAAGPAPAQDEFVAAITARLPQVPRYHQKIRRVPFDLAPPVWVDDDAFRPEDHFARLSVPSPHDDAALCELVTLLMDERLDRDRPLWMLWVIEGLSEGRWAILSKVHHSLTDGVSATGLQRVLFGAAEPPGLPAAPVPDPGRTRLLVSALGDLVSSPVTGIGHLVGSVLHPRALARRTTDVVRGLAALSTALMPVAPSSLSGPLGHRRGYAVGQAALADIVTTAKAFDVTVNDVLLAAVTGGLRELLLRRGEDPAPDSVRSLVPVSVRNSASVSEVDNRVSLLLPLLPVDLPDPVHRLLRVHRRVTTLKGNKESAAGEFVTGAAGTEPFAASAWVMRAAAKLPQRNIVTVTTNVPGPPEPLSVAGREVLELYPYVPIALRLRTGVAMLTYRDRVFFGVTADRATVPDVRFLAETVVAEVAVLKAAAVSSARTTPDPPDPAGGAGRWRDRSGADPRP